MVGGTSEGSKRTHVIAKAILVTVVLAVNIVCVMTILSLVGAETATPYIYLDSFNYVNNMSSSGLAYVSVRGSVVNPTSLAANNVSVVLDVYVKYMNQPLNTTVIDLGGIPAASSKSFNADFAYPGGESAYFLFDYADSSLLLSSRFDFGVGFFAIVLPLAVLLPVLDIYCAYNFGFFGWVKARKKVVAVTVVWSVVIALMIITSYWLFYNGLKVGQMVSSFSNAIGFYPQLYSWGWIPILVSSIIAGVLIADLETVVYSFATSLVLSTIFEVVFAFFFVWYGLGFNEGFAIITPGLVFTTYVESIIGGVFLTILRMISIIVPTVCLLGVLAGAIVRGLVEPTVDA
jgi:hypothetical protein